MVITDGSKLCCIVTCYASMLACVLLLMDWSPVLMLAAGTAGGQGRSVRAHVARHEADVRVVVRAVAADGAAVQGRPDEHGLLMPMQCAAVFSICIAAATNCCPYNI
jgi:hypothetical protein